jgi:hypothetical protein
LLRTSASSNSRFLKTSEQHFPTARYNGAEEQQQDTNGYFAKRFLKTSDQHFPTARYNGAEEQKAEFS